MSIYRFDNSFLGKAITFKNRDTQEKYRKLVLATKLTTGKFIL